MSASFDLPTADRFTTGAIGPPGQRVFYLQAVAGTEVVSLKVEKAQVAALCRYFAAMLDDLPNPAELPGNLDLDLVEPVLAEWVVGSLGVSYDERADRVVVVAEELVVTDDDEGGEPTERVAGDSEPPARARIRTTREQISAFVRRGAEVVQAGRPLCQLCGGPVDPEGHMCTRLNGHRHPPTS